MYALRHKEGVVLISIKCGVLSTWLTSRVQKQGHFIDIV